MNEFRGRQRPEQIKARPPSPEQGAERREQTIQTVVDQMTALARQYGPEAVQKILASMHQAMAEARPLQAGEIVKSIETQPDRLEFQKNALEALERLGFIERLPDGRLVVDSDKLMHEFSIQDVKEAKGYTSSRITFLGDAFADQQVILRKDLAEDPEHAIAKPMFYLPKTQTEALDVAAIQASQFHFGLWEIPYGNRGTEQSAIAMEQPASLTEQGYFETSLAAVLYHPKYGNAHRDDRGRLLVRSRKGDVPVSGQWLEDQGFKFAYEGTPQYVGTKPKEALNKFAPHAVERGLIRPDDFGYERASNRAQETSRVSSNGQVGLEGVRHYLGRQYVGKAIRIDTMGNGVAALVEIDGNGQGQPVGLINAFEKGDPRLTERKTNTGSFFEAGGKLTEPRAYNEQEFAEPKPGENPDSFFARKQKFEAFKAVLHFDNALKQETNLAVFNLSRELQTEIRTHGDKIGKNEQLYLDFAKTFGKDGLEIVAAIIENSSIAQQTLETTLKLPQAEQAALLPRLHDALLARRQALDELKARQAKGEINDLEARKFTFEINRRVTSLLTAAEDSAVIQESLDANAKDEALERLAEQGSELTLFARIFKDAFKGTNAMDFEQMRGLALETVHGGEIDQDTRSAMLQVFDTNWKQENPKFFDLLREGFEKKLMTPTKTTEFEILKKDGEILAFVRFDDRPDLGPGALYTGSINVNPALRGSAVGEAMMRATIDEKAQRHTQYLHVNPNSIVGMKYVEDFGFHIIGVEASAPNKQGETFKRFLMKRDDNEAELLKSPPTRERQFDTRNGTTEMVEAVQDELANGNIAIRYFRDQRNPRQVTLVFVRDPQAPNVEPKLTPAPRPRPASTYTQTAPGESLQY